MIYAMDNIQKLSMLVILENFISEAVILIAILSERIIFGVARHKKITLSVS